MRVWLVNPKQMSDAHLLGQHQEIHMLDSMLKNPRFKNHPMVEYYRDKTGWLKWLHDELVKEMDFRFDHLARNGGKHPSPFPNYRKNLDWQPPKKWIAYDQTDMASRWYREPKKHKFTERTKPKFKPSRVASADRFIEKFGPIPAHREGQVLLGQ